MNWLNTLNRLNNDGVAAILITVIENKGSTPRDAGTKMIVTSDEIYDTIGGGHLEHKAIKQARQLLAEHCSYAQLENYALGASLGQCCGGSIQLLFEPINPPALHIALFGAGHVAKALIPLLGNLPCKVTWIDNRPEQFTETFPSNVTRCLCDEPVDKVPELPTFSYCLVMTHNHQLDQALVEAILKRGDYRYLGMIGSNTKRRKFEHRLRHKGFKENTIELLHCPVGLSEICGKLPGEIAVSIAAELITHYQIAATRNKTNTVTLTQQTA
ncbi:xanthine dehydrogenase accessory protein XdhC [Neptunomonas sp.]|uniref:xanthine dehydrogenase accessory protein XdhC n=1 Tax=Neptunomonas sp. TaxID=1971898 RepID=UPI002601413F|nr:xanthine dehydrogenase accessory protein XdhC [Neptunomonas sp.]